MLLFLINFKDVRHAVFNLGVYKTFLALAPSPMLCIRIICAVECAKSLDG